MKTISQVSSRERIEHHGDLTITGNVGKNAWVEIYDGSLMIKGNVQNGATIKVKAANLEAVSPHIASGIMSDIDGASGTLSGLVSTPKKFSCKGKVFQGDVQILKGPVNIDNRIITEGQVKISGIDIYEITSGNVAAASSSSSQFVSANIDGIKYRGQTIKVLGKKVLVDGKTQIGFSDSAAKDSESHFSSKHELIVKGYISPSVTIESDIHLKANDISHHCKITTKQGITANNVGYYSSLCIKGPINIRNIENNVTISTFREEISQEKTTLYTTGNFENDLETAIKESLKVSGALEVTKVGMFKQTAVEAPSPKPVEILPSLECPISKQPFKDPVYCSLDGRTYDRSEITNWLKIKGTSPLTGAMMKPGDSIESVLKPNYTFRDVLDEFFEANPALTPKTSP